MRGWASAWSQWETCSRSCGRGFQTRSRVCSTSVCEGMKGSNSTEMRQCDEIPCCPGTWFFVKVVVAFNMQPFVVVVVVVVVVV